MGRYCLCCQQYLCAAIPSHLAKYTLTHFRLTGTLYPRSNPLLRAILTYPRAHIESFIALIFAKLVQNIQRIDKIAVGIQVVLIELFILSSFLRLR